MESALFGSILVLLASGLLSVVAAAPEQDRGRELGAAWKSLRPNLPGDAVKRSTDAYPLSDQRNRGGWVKYAPMSDEFEWTSLDSTKWNPFNPTWKGRQPAFFSRNNVAVRKGMLELTMRKEDPPQSLKPEGYHTFSSAAVQSKGLVKYGYFEVRAQAMRSAGSSAFWFYHQTPEKWTEIDVFEIGGRSPGFERKLNMTVHVFHTPEEKKHWQIHDAWIAPHDLDADFHVYGLEWGVKELRFYFDGVLVRKGPNTHWHQPLTLNFDSETMPDWFGLPKDSDLPSTFSIDYVRAWKRRGDPAP